MSSYHGWTHAPKEQGGTDPVLMPASGGATSWARCSARVTGNTLDYVEPAFDTGAFSSFYRIDDGLWSLNGSERLVLAAGNPGLYRIDLVIHDFAADAGLNSFVRVLTNLVATAPTAYWLPSQFDTPVASTDVIETNFPIYHDDNAEAWIPQGSAGGFYHNTVSWLLYMSSPMSNAAVFRIRTAYLENNAFTTEQFDVAVSVAKVADVASVGVTSS